MDKIISTFFLIVVFITISPRTLIATVTQQPIATVPEISLQDCYRECNTRLSCQSIGYNRRALFCQIYSQQWAEVSTQREAGVVRKNVGEIPELTTTKVCSKKNCLDGQDCNSECEKKQCREPAYSKNVTIKGNMRNTNSRIAIVCNNFFTMVYSTCTQTGTWSNAIPTCTTHNYNYVGENTAGVTTNTSFIIVDTYLDACLKMCNETSDCFGVNYFPNNKSCISTNTALWSNASNSNFYHYSEFPITHHTNNGTGYDFTPTEALAFCESIGTTIATYMDLVLAYELGFDLCRCGWTDMGTPYIVIQEACDIFSPGVQICWRGLLFDVFCKNEKYNKWP